MDRGKTRLEHKEGTVEQHEGVRKETLRVEEGGADLGGGGGGGGSG
jgi:hypothetical protein